MIVKGTAERVAESRTLADPDLQSVADSKEPHLQRPLPSEVWATVFGYAGRGAGPLQPDQISPFRLLSRSITAGLDEWIRLEMDQTVKRDGSLRLAQASPDGKAAPFHAQKRALIALSKAPTEFLKAITKLEGDFLGGVPWSANDRRLVSPPAQPLVGEHSLRSLKQVGEQAVMSVLSQLSNLTCTGRSFLSLYRCLRVVDLSP
jgi:hypothetical protein